MAYGDGCNIQRAVDDICMEVSPEESPWYSVRQARKLRCDAVAVLKELEWNGDRAGDLPCACCPYCGGFARAADGLADYEIGHASNCTLARLIGSPRREAE